MIYQRYIKQILSGVSHLHSKGYFHRDLKPLNILVFGDTMKITDFGMSKDFRSSVGRFTPDVCSFFYRAPELMITAIYEGAFTNHGCYNAKIDTWSIGVIFLQMISGRVPFCGSPGDKHTQIELLSGMVNALGDPPSTVYPLYKDIKFKRTIKYEFPWAYFIGFDGQQKVVQGLLDWDPSIRLSASVALELLNQ